MRGDGSCWNYAVLAHGGHASASDARNGTHRTPPARAQLVSDRALRQAIALWCLANDGARRLANDDDADGRALAEVTTRAPLYGARGLLRHGGFGGDMQFVALADLLGCDIFTFDHAARGDATGVWYEHGESARGSRGRWTTGFGAVGRTLSAVVAHCASARTRLIVMIHHPLHWHALLPARGRSLPGLDAVLSPELVGQAAAALMIDELIAEEVQGA